MFLVPLSKIRWLFLFGFISGCYILNHLFVSVFMPELCSYFHSGSMVQFEVSYCDTSSITFYSQDHFRYLGSFVIPYEFRIISFSISVKKIIGILMRIALNLYITLGNITGLTVFILSFHEEGRVFHHLQFFSSVLCNFHCKVFSISS
jgi:hypothetical protein